MPEDRNSFSPAPFSEPVFPPMDYREVVLLVDDEPAVSEAIRTALANQSDLDFHYCGNPHEAVAAATRLRPSLILLALVMPELDGLPLVGQLRANAPTRDTPIVLMSDTDNPNIKSHA